jgi:tetratricopeptide (TPR) repeat protein
MRQVNGRTGMAVTVLAAFTAGLLACQASPQAEMAAAQSAFDSGVFEVAYDKAAPLALRRGDALGAEAAYVAGMSAYRLRRIAVAEQYLQIAIDRGEALTRANARAMLGVIYVDQGRYARASKALLEAAVILQGQDRANAYFYAAAAEQRLQRWATARTHLTLARAASSDDAFRQRAAEQLRHTGWTIQIASFDDQAQAQAAANQLPDRLAPTVARMLDDEARPRYVVRHGRFSTFELATEARRQIGLDDAVVTSFPMTAQ